jgi:UDPglucose--hexose-1-phosphate uridylyltransferase
MEFAERPHKRWNPLTGEWILVSPHRLKRPWQGQVEKLPPETRPAHDPGCYLCPGNRRAEGRANPDYAGTFVFDNDFAALLPDGDPMRMNEDDLLVAHTERGICRVLCFSPRHDLTLARMDVADIAAVVDTWVEQYRELGAMPGIRHVQIFENRGAMMGCSNPHPHGQIWATETLPGEPEKEDGTQRAWHARNGGTLLGAYLQRELAAGERVVCRNAHWAVLVPFWAKWPFETLLLPVRAVPDMTALTADERGALAEILRGLTIRYDNLFNVSFPYSMGFHQAPTDGGEHPHWHMHAHFYPPLLRSATIQKFMVGFEMLGNPQRDITPEAAAARLREVPEIHHADTPNGEERK